MRYTKKIIAVGVGTIVLMVGGIGVEANNKIARVEPIEFRMPQARQQMRNTIATTTEQVVQAEAVKKQNAEYINSGGNWVDNDGDGVCDNAGTGAGSGTGGGNWVDDDGDGACDNAGIGAGSGNGEKRAGNGGNGSGSGNARKGTGSGNGARGNGGGRR